MDFKIKDSYDIQDLLLLVALLRDQEKGCEWDRVQTSKTIRRGIIEESYEVAQAIDEEDLGALKEELGDVLFQVVSHGQIHAEKQEFDFGEICNGIVKKMVFRHPHLFGGEQLSWEENKQREKQYKSAYDKCQQVPKALPALMRGKKVLRRGQEGGFCPDFLKNPHEILKNLAFILDNPNQNCNNIEIEMGRGVLALIHLADRRGLDLEQVTDNSISWYIESLKNWEQHDHK